MNELCSTVKFDVNVEGKSVDQTTFFLIEKTHFIRPQNCPLFSRSRSRNETVYHKLGTKSSNAVNPNAFRYYFCVSSKI